MEGIAIFFIFFAVIAITALLFGGWVVVMLVKFVLRGIMAAVSPAALHPPVPKPVGPTVRCDNERCKNANPAIARFCRRCGNALPVAQRVPVRRVAMW